MSTLCCQLIALIVFLSFQTSYQTSMISECKPLLATLGVWSKHVHHWWTESLCTSSLDAYPRFRSKSQAPPIISPGESTLFEKMDDARLMCLTTKCIQLHTFAHSRLCSITTGILKFAECFYVCRVYFFGHSANNLFVVCWAKNTRKKTLGKKIKLFFLEKKKKKKMEKNFTECSDLEHSAKK